MATTAAMAVIGAGCSRLAGDRTDVSLQELIFEGAGAALADANLLREQLDSVVISASDLVDGRGIANMSSAAAAGAPASPKHVLEPEDLPSAENKGGEPICPRDIILLHTGWYSRTRAITEYVEQSPSVSRSAGEWVRARRIGSLGVDLPSPDSHGARDLPIHMNFLRPRSLGLDESDYILIYENLVSIDRIPRRYGKPRESRGRVRVRPREIPGAC